MGKRSNYYALLVGVGQDLEETINDALSLEAVFKDETKGGYNSSNIITLISEQSRRDIILNKLDALIAQTQNNKDTTIIIYFSGHGEVILEGEIPNYYLVPYGSDIANLNTLISASIFNAKINELNTERLLIILDCCHASGITNSINSSVYKAPIAKMSGDLISAFSRDRSCVSISSCDDNEISIINEGERNSLFTQVLIEALNGINSLSENVNISDIIHYVTNIVPIKARPNQQNPIVNCDNLKDYHICTNSKYIPPEIDMNKLNELFEIGKKQKSLLQTEIKFENIINENKEIFDDSYDLAKDEIININKVLGMPTDEANLNNRIKFYKSIGGKNNLSRVQSCFKKSLNIEIDNMINSSNTIERSVLESIDKQVKLNFINTI